MPEAVSDSSVLIHLALLGRLTLLQDFYDQVMIPPAVWREVVEEGQGRAGAREVKEASQSGWLKVFSPTDASLLRLLQHELDAGEAEAIALAVERRADVLLIDETHARRIADIYELPKTGVIGLLIRAQAAGKIISLRSELDRLRQNAGFWISDDLYKQVLAAAGENLDTSQG